uniref:Disease resistance protein At4g27190-like leucine-rich repeats domain-containing protein n=1 Tax=Cucumis melo TaxID=3656 RepID=A0A9I9E1X5_CUCME
KLKHLWSEECSQNNITSVLQHLCSLGISDCGRLSSLVSSLVCFTNLQHLHVNKCHRLTHLLNPSVATTLVQLEGLTVEECKRMSSVIEEGSTEEDGNDEMKDYDDERCHPKYPKEMLVEDMNVMTREYWEDNVDTGIPNLFAEQSLEENRSENSSSSKNNVEKE